MNKPVLDFYYYDMCPYCSYVQSTINELNIKVNYKNILEDRKNLEKLVADTGRRTVPCLYIDGRPMFESSDIIMWLQANKDNLEKESE